MTSVKKENKSFTKDKSSIKEQLVQAHHLAAKLQLDDTIFTHLSCRCPENPDLFYLTPFGYCFQEVTTENLLTLSLWEESQGVKSPLGLSVNAVSPSTYTPSAHAPSLKETCVNPAGSILHSGFYEANPETQCVVHFHSPSALAVSCLQDGLLPLSQFAFIFYQRLGYHPFEGISLDPKEKSALIKSLGPHKAMLLRNHGLLTVADSIPQAFMTAYYLERSCEIQLKAQATGQPLVFPPPDICEKTARQFEGPEYGSRTLAWDALVRGLNNTK